MGSHYIDDPNIQGSAEQLVKFSGFRCLMPWPWSWEGTCGFLGWAACVMWLLPICSAPRYYRFLTMLMMLLALLLAADNENYVYHRRCWHGSSPSEKCYLAIWAPGEPKTLILTSMLQIRIRFLVWCRQASLFAGQTGLSETLKRHYFTKWFDVVLLQYTLVYFNILILYNIL